MGRASKKKNRLRAVDGGIYSKLFESYQYKGLYKAYADLEKGKSIENIYGTMNSIVDFFNISTLEMLKIPAITKGGIIRNKFILLSSYIKYKRYCHHYFLTDNDLVLFLENQKIKKDSFGYLPDIIKEYCPPKEDKIIELNFFTGIIHLLDRRYSICFILSKGHDPETGKISDGFMLYHDRGDGEGSEDTATLPLDKNYIDDNLKQINNKNTVLNWRIIFNMFLYIDAFPEAIKSGPPPVKRLDFIKSLSNTTIGETEAIKGLYNNSSDHYMSPHLRRGHYRFLKSDRYKKKRFQTVFVRPAMVKGTADHIIDVEKAH